MAKLTSSRRELKKIKKICCKVTKKYESSSSNRYSSDYDSSHSSDRNLDELR